MSERRNGVHGRSEDREELLNLLAQVPDLTVIARILSSFAFKGQNIEIARSSRLTLMSSKVACAESGRALRFLLQLIRTADSTQLWSETYD